MNEDEYELEKEEALRDYNISKNDLRKIKLGKLKVTLIIIFILLIVLIVVRVIFGKIYFSLPFLNYNKSIEYKLLVNGEHRNIDFEDNEDTMIIPGVLYFRRSNYGVWYNMERYNEDLIFVEDKVVLDFKVSECYTHTDNVRVNCDSTNDKLVHKEVMPKFKSIYIRRNGKNNVTYDGEFINDISSYVKESGFYYIEILAEYDGVETKLVLFPRREESVK